MVYRECDACGKVGIGWFWYDVREMCGSGGYTICDDCFDSMFEPCSTESSDAWEVADESSSEGKEGPE